MTAPPLQTKFTVISGTSREPSRTFPWGSPIETFAVGSQGDWRIFADGVLGVHFYLRFDGRQAHIAPAAQDALVIVKGQALDQKWHPVPVLSNIEFGSARLYVVCEDQSVAPPAQARPSVPVLSPPAVHHQPVVMEKHGLDRTQPIAPPAPAPPSPENALAPAVRQEHAPAPEVRQEHAPAPAIRQEHAPVPAVRHARGPDAGRGFNVEWSTMIDGGALREYARKVADGSADSARVHAETYASEVRARGSSSPPPRGSEAPPGAVRQSDAPAPHQRAPGQSDLSPAPRQPVPGQSDADRARPRTPGQSDGPPPHQGTASQPEDVAPLADGPSRPASKSRLVQAWRETSNVKKLIAVMLPLLGWVVLQEQETTEPPVSVEMSRAPSGAPSAHAGKAPAPPSSSARLAGTLPATAPSAAPSSDVAPSEGGVPVAAAPASAGPMGAAPLPVEKPSTTTATFAPTPGRSPLNGLGSSPAERAALDAAFEGKLGAAGILYTSLASEHPTSPVYGLAARMVREKAVRKP